MGGTSESAFTTYINSKTIKPYKMKYLVFFASLVLLLFLGSCNQDQDILTGTDGEETTHTTYVNAAFNGYITDIAGNAIDGALVQIKEETVTTGPDGYFAITGNVNQAGAYLRVSSEGYFEAYANVTPTLGKTKQIRFTLLERKSTGTINASQGGPITQADYSIVFAPDSFKDQNDMAYTGEVTVYSTYLDPTSSDLAMPGDLMGVSSSEDPVLLVSYGMVNVELEGSSGQKLQLSSAAELTIRVPSDKRSAAEPTIPLWYFDTTDGLWKEDGSATLEGDSYRGTVSHFTLWNCDLDFYYSELGGTVYYDGAPTTSVWVEVEWLSMNDKKVAFVDATGSFSGKVPLGADLAVRVYDFCDNLLATEYVDSENTDLVINASDEPCLTDNAYSAHFGFNENTIHVIPDVTVTVLDPMSTGYSYQFEFTDKNQDVDVEYDYYVKEKNGGGYEFVIETTGAVTDDTEVYKVVGAFDALEETADHVYISQNDILWEVHQGETGNYSWYPGPFFIRGKK